MGSGEAAVLEVLLRIVVPDQWIPLHPFTAAVQGGTAIQLGVVFLAGVVLAPLAEETLFRGYLQVAISRRFGFPAGALGSILVFALLHPNPVTVAFGFLLGTRPCCKVSFQAPAMCRRQSPCRWDESQGSPSLSRGIERGMRDVKTPGR